MQTLKKVKVSQLRPNPYRRLDKGYPIDRNKVDKLKESYRETGYWGNILCRPGKRDGTYEIAYGHHRLVAAQEELGKNAIIVVAVEKMTDEMMIKRMARENLEEWGSNAAVEHETIRTVVDAHADGTIDLSPYIDPKTNIRYLLAPGSVVDAAGDHLPDRPPAYSRLSVALFLGWTSGATTKQQPTEAFDNAWKALQLVETGDLDVETFRGKTRAEAKVIVDAAVSSKKEAEHEAYQARMAASRLRKAADKGEIDEKQAQRQIAKAKEIEAEAEKRARKDARASAKAAARVLDKGEGASNAKKAAIGARAKKPAVKVAPPRIDAMAESLATYLASVLAKDSDQTQKLKALVKFRGELKPAEITKLSRALRELAVRADRFADQLDEPAAPVNGAVGAVRQLSHR